MTVKGAAKWRKYTVNYPESRKLVVISNSGKQEETTAFGSAVEPVDLCLEPYGIKIIGRYYHQGGKTVEKSKKFAWTWKVKEECLEEYVRMHLDPWPEILEEHSRAGIRNYSIFQNGNQFFYCFECDDVGAAFDYIARSEACNRWNAVTSKMVEGSFDFNENEPIKPMKEVFFLK